jgi:pyruvate dehydrogenase E2 component (dihydrolipoamide acetyltransferase)
MGYIIKMPQMGLEMEEGEVVAWEVDVDEPTEEGDIVVVVESEKAVNEVEAREDGAVREIFVPEGKVVEPGDPIGVFGGPEEDITDLIAEAEAMSDTSAAESASAGSDDEPSETGDPRGATASEEQIRATPGAEKLANDMGIDLSVIDGSGPQGTITEADVEQQASDEGIEESSSPSVRATPGAKQVAEERGVELTSIDGTGPQGVVTESDVEDHAGAGTDDGSTAVRTVSESRRLSSIQQTISDRMSASHREAPHVTLNRSFDATTLREVQTAAANEGVDVSLTDLLVRGVGMELADRPAFNALFEDGTHKLIEEVNIGIAVDIEEGLVTPVVPSVAEKSVEEIAAVRRERTQRALNGEFEMSDMEGGTFTITNLGMFDIDSFDPIINPPEVAILGVGRIQDDGAMILSLSFDHRVVNGADAARFLDGTVGNLTDAKWLADQFDENIFGALIEHLSE